MGVLYQSSSIKMGHISQVSAEQPPPGLMSRCLLPLTAIAREGGYILFGFQ